MLYNSPNTLVEIMVHPIAMPSNRTIRIATMHGLAVMLVLLFCLLFMPTHAQLQSRPEAISGNITTSPSCIPHERDALLAFKNGITSDPAGLLDSWRRGDCCRWRGVRCSNRTGHVHKLRLRGNYELEEAALVGKISSSLLALEHLEYLDLSHNSLDGSIPEFLGSLKSLKYLNLSAIPFYGEVPPQLGNLSKLQYLDLSSVGETYSFQGTYSTDLSWLTRLPSIQYLNLDGINLSTVVDWPHVMNMLPSLRTLRLSSCYLVSANQSLPHLNLTNIEELDVSNNYFNHPMVTSWFWNITSVKYLYLDSTGLYGQFPNALGGMASLQVFDLSYGDYYYYYNDDDDDGQKMNMRMMTTDLMNLCKLEVLNLHSALLYGDITELLRNLPRCSPNKLRELDLSSNQLTGMLPRWIGQLTSLVILNLGWNNITGPLPKSIGQLSGLKTLDLSRNNLNGNVPYEIGMLSNLSMLDLNNNKLDGVIMKEHFASARSLEMIDLSYNALKIELRSNWKPPSKLYIVNFASCQMGPLFPRWLQWHVSITNLDISSAGIADRLPQWFSDAFSNVYFLNISNNQLNRTLPTDMGSMSLNELYLSSNQLTGQIPTLPPNLRILDLSNNFLSGPLPSAVGSANLLYLSLFSNRLTGRIPESFCKYRRIYQLDLSNNFLEGELPSCLRVMEDMEFVSLSNNSFSGKFPSSLQHLTKLIFLDLSWNKFYGRLPMWIGSLTLISVIRLSHNNFYGSIPMNIANLSCLQYLDLNNNKISGSLPIYLSNLKSMTNADMIFACSARIIDISHPLSSLSTVWKGRELNYGSIARILDTSMTSIDLSLNNLTGEIPEEIVILDGLVNLNLSRNHLTGVIPKKIGEMRSLQSLDLSRNMLSGTIPATLSNLTFLSYLELSYNNLTGRIPSGAQLDTLYEEYPFMYSGNIGLCGHPLQNNCSSEGHAPKQGGMERTKEGHGIPFFYLGLGCGFIVGTWIAFLVLLFKRNWRIACFRLSDKLYDQVYVLVATWARARQTQTD